MVQGEVQEEEEEEELKEGREVDKFILVHFILFHFHLALIRLSFLLKLNKEIKDYL